MPKALIVYRTRYGAAARTTEDIAETLLRGGVDVEVVYLKKAQVADISNYELAIGGSGSQINKWIDESKFLKKFQKELAKKVALFVCRGSAAPMDDKVDKAKSIADTKRKYQ